MSNYIAGDLTFYNSLSASVDVGIVIDPKRAYWLHTKNKLSFSGDTTFYTKIACEVLGAWGD